MLTGKQFDRISPIASVSKLMTVIVSLDTTHGAPGRA
ncbi:hypothetical protein RI103_31755 [Paraburkholderia sp. FT54]|jgi:D-alanyl-D-alanine carboxypeptidase|nr:hypothetical protein [Paraburkholderia sp. FT54]WNC92790.1 hypothetical protein RI103_31755 [Paraburkholderia sp. FT54]